MPTWLIALIIVVGSIALYAGLTLATGAALKYQRGRRMHYMDHGEILIFSVVWPFGLVIAVCLLLSPVAKRMVHPIMTAWDSAYNYGDSHDRRKQSRAEKREAKQLKKQSELNLQREFVDLCKQNGWDPKDVMKRQRAKQVA